MCLRALQIEVGGASSTGSRRAPSKPPQKHPQKIVTHPSYPDPPHKKKYSRKRDRTRAPHSARQRVGTPKEKPRSARSQPIRRRRRDRAQHRRRFTQQERARPPPILQNESFTEHGRTREANSRQ